MGRSATYVCPTCGATIERPFRTASVIRTCENGCPFDHHFREDLLAAIERVPESARPDDWSERPVKERLLVAMREGIVSRDDL